MKKEMLVERILKEELNHIAPKLVSEMGIINPTYTFDEGYYVASAHATITTNTFTINDCEFSGRISFNPKAIYIQAINLFGYMPKEEAIKYVTRQAIYHEHRHAYQYTHMKHFFIGTSVICKDLVIGSYGAQPHEEDANNYAIDKASNEKEELAFRIQRLVQRSVRTFGTNALTREEGVELSQPIS